ncbi:hypothetical protein JYT74_01910 [Crocinitomix catalasitica]|nr:hypothetical protein [Crocinitomix catalasitica]
MKFYVLLLSILLISCGSSKSASRSVLPSSVDVQIEFGMSLAEFSTAKDTAKMVVDHGQSFRTAFTETSDNENIEAFVYYFDNDGDKILYEIIIVYKSESERQLQAEALFGNPNYDSKEWRLSRKDSFNVWAWPFKNKLVVVAMLPGTEWSDENW